MFAATAWWALAARLSLRFLERGTSVAALCPIGHPLRHVPGIGRIYTYRAFRSLQLEAIEPKRRIAIARSAIGARASRQGSAAFLPITRRAVDDRRLALRDDRLHERSPLAPDHRLAAPPACSPKMPPQRPSRIAASPKPTHSRILNSDLDEMTTSLLLRGTAWTPTHTPRPISTFARPRPSERMQWQPPKLPTLASSGSPQKPHGFGSSPLRERSLPRPSQRPRSARKPAWRRR